MRARLTSAVCRRTRASLHAVGLKLMIDLPARDDAYDYKFFGKECDAIVLMNFDQHWVSSPPGPIAAQDWFVENLRQILEVVPAQKIVVGIANFAYDWARNGTRKEPGPPPSSACRKRCCTPSNRKPTSISTTLR